MERINHIFVIAFNSTPLSSKSIKKKIPVINVRKSILFNPFIIIESTTAADINRNSATDAHIILLARFIVNNPPYQINLILPYKNSMVIEYKQSGDYLP